MRPFGALTTWVHGQEKKGELRVVIVFAESLDDALKKAESEAKAYQSSLTGVRWTGYVNVYEGDNESIKDGYEIFSVITKSIIAIDSELG